MTSLILCYFIAISLADSIISYLVLKLKALNKNFPKIGKNTTVLDDFYQKATDRQHKFHFSINTSDFHLRLKSCWKNSLPSCFAINKQNYAHTMAPSWKISTCPIQVQRKGCKKRGSLFLEIPARNQFNIRVEVQIQFISYMCGHLQKYQVKYNDTIKEGSYR